jgi:hypothetical protein
MIAQHIWSFIKTPEFRLKEYFHRRPDPKFDWHFCSGEAAAKAEEGYQRLNEDGIVMLPNYFTGGMLQELQNAFDKSVADKWCKLNPNSLQADEFFTEDPVFLRAALDPVLLEIIGRYYKKKFALGRSCAQRLLPADTGRYGSYQWHHDTRGRQLHLMILLKDLPADGQRMSYLAKSHQTYYSFLRGRGQGSRFDNDLSADPKLKDRIVEVAGPAGTVAIFDANGLHSGNRNDNGGRDQITFCYVSVRHWKDQIFRRAEVEKLPEPFKQVVTFNPKHKLVD